MGPDVRRHDAWDKNPFLAATRIEGLRVGDAAFYARLDAESDACVMANHAPNLPPGSAWGGECPRCVAIQRLLAFEAIATLRERLTACESQRDSFEKIAAERDMMAKHHAVESAAVRAELARKQAEWAEAVTDWWRKDADREADKNAAVAAATRDTKRRLIAEQDLVLHVMRERDTLQEDLAAIVEAADDMATEFGRRVTWPLVSAYGLSLISPPEAPRGT